MIALSDIKDKHEKIDELAVFEKKGWNLLLPSMVISGLKGVLDPVLETVQLSPEPDEKDVYYNKQMKSFCITAQGLKKISICGNIEWNSAECHPVQRLPDYVSYQAVGGIRKADGKLYQEIGTADLDMKAFKEDLAEKYNGKAFEKTHKKYNDGKAPSKDYIAYCIDRDFRQKRQFMLEQTETKAKNRVIRSLFNIKPSYTKQQLAKPFVILRFSFQPDMNDKDIQKMIVQEFFRSRTALYGPAPAAQLDAPDVIDVPPVDADQGQDVEQTEGDLEPSRQEVFEGYDKKAKVETLKKEIEIKGYDKKKLAKPLNQKWSNEHLNDFFTYLETLQPVKETHDDEIPF